MYLGEFDAASMPPATRHRWIERFPGTSPFGYDISQSWGRQWLVRLGTAGALPAETAQQRVRRLAFETAWNREGKQVVDAALKRAELNVAITERAGEIEQQRQREAAPSILAQVLTGLRGGGMLATVALVGLGAFLLAQALRRR